MLKKRLIGVVTVKNGWAVQSFGYRRHLPLGVPKFWFRTLTAGGQTRSWCNALIVLLAVPARI